MFLLFAIGMTANAQKFALIDMEYILKNIPAYQSATEELDQASRQWQSEVEKLGKEAKGLYDSYQASIKTLSDAQKSKKEEEIVAKEKSAEESYSGKVFRCGTNAGIFKYIKSFILYNNNTE